MESVASFIPDNAMRQQFLQRFRRKPLQQAYRNGKSELQQELLSYYDDKSIRWTRMTARLIANPNTGDLEAILYGMDISREKNYEARIASAQQEKSALLELAQQDPLTGLSGQHPGRAVCSDLHGSGLFQNHQRHAGAPGRRSGPVRCDPAAAADLRGGQPALPLRRRRILHSAASLQSFHFSS